MEHELSFEVFYHFENVPTFMQKNHARGIYETS